MQKNTFMILVDDMGIYFKSNIGNMGFMGFQNKIQGNWCEKEVSITNQMKDWKSIYPDIMSDKLIKTIEKLEFGVGSEILADLSDEITKIIK